MITLNSTTEIDNKQKWIRVTLTVDGDECQFTHVAPIELEEADLQNFIDSKESSYRFDILRDMYPEARKDIDYIVDEGQIELQALEEWIADGAMLRDEEGKFVEKATKVDWKGTHPDIYTASGVEKESLFEAAQDLANNLTYADVDNHIDTVFGSLNVAQKTSLKKLYKVVLYLLKK